MAESIGLRVARWRDINGLTQQQLADAVGVTQAYISQIENGQRPVTKRSLLYNLATALNVNISDLTGAPGVPRTADQMVIWATVPAVRTALDEDPMLTARPLEALTGAVDAAMRARMNCDYGYLRVTLPALISELRINAEEMPERRFALELQVRTYVTAALTLKPFGFVDLASRFADQAYAAALELGDRPAEIGAAVFAQAQTALAGGARRKSLRLSDSGADMFDAPHSDQALTWLGMLRLHAALSAASLGLRAEATAHLEEAHAAAHLVRSDPWRMEFTKANAALWAVGVALENGSPESAPDLARQIDPTALRTKNRLARLYIDTGRGYFAAGKAGRAVAAFLRAAEIAPDEVRARSTVVEIVGQLIRDTRTVVSGEPLALLASKLGIDPIDWLST
jgi:transcriptional regulator with XRE-family HTH domain